MIEHLHKCCSCKHGVINKNDDWVCGSCLIKYQYCILAADSYINGNYSKECERFEAAKNDR